MTIEYEKDYLKELYESVNVKTRNIVLMLLSLKNIKNVLIH